MGKAYNLLTQRLLAEGYTAERHPDYVYPGRTCQNREDPLDNLDGGFEYYRWYVYERTFKTPCGLQCRGLSCMAGLYYGGREFRFENDAALVRCPYHSRECAEKDVLLREAGPFGDWCSVHMTDEAYQYEGSVEGILKLEDDRIRREKISFDLMHHGRTCENHMHYDHEKREWVMHYDPCGCARVKCNGHFGQKYEAGCLICPILGRPLDPKKGNVYYDIKTTFRRYDLDGTLFEGQVDTQIQKGVRFLSAPVSMDICRNIVKLCRDEIEQRVKLKYHQELFFAEYHGREFSIEILNIRAEQRESRDLMQDLQDIREGIQVFHASDAEKQEKQHKKERRQQAKEKRVKAVEKKILDVGYSSMERIDQMRACRLLSPERIKELEYMREENLKEEQKKPVQMSIFDIMQEGGAFPE